MQVQAIRRDFREWPVNRARLNPSTAMALITIDHIYEVYAIAVFEGRVSIQIINDVDIIDWLPAWFFQTVDAAIPEDWIVKLLDGNLQLVMGPDFVAADEAAYSRMVELEPEPVAAFWQRLDARAD